MFASVLVMVKEGAGPVPGAFLHGSRLANVAIGYARIVHKV